MKFDKKTLERKFITNSNIDETYFLDLLKLFPNEGYIKILYCYYLFNYDKLIEGNEVLKSINIHYIDKEDFSFHLFVSTLYDSDNLIEDLLKLNSEYPNNIFCLFELFMSLKDTEDNFLAWGFLEKAIEIEPYFFEARLQKILYDDSLDNCSEIIQELLKFPQTYVDTRVLNKLAFSYYNCYEIENAIKIAKGSLEIDKTAETYYILGSIEHNENNNFKEALNYYNLCLEIDSSYLDCLNSKAWLLYDFGDISDSEKIFLQILEIDQSISSYGQLMQFYLNANNLEKVVSVNDLLISKHGNNHISDTFSILYSLKKNEKEKLNLKLQNFKQSYTDEQVEWLKSMILDYK